MKQTLILVEGQTEENFVKSVLSPYLLTFEINIIPTIINTKIIKGGNNFKGGLNNYQQIKRDLLKLIKDKSVFTTTLIDYYGLPNDFPGKKETLVMSDIYSKVTHIEKKLATDINNKRFIPYIQIHEYESLLFSDIKGFEQFYSGDNKILAGIKGIINQYPNPEEINDNPETAPSKRILKLIPNYQKAHTGIIIAQENGIECAMEKCPHFKEWINKIISA